LAPRVGPRSPWKNIAVAGDIEKVGA
jgi:hypothetical protein